MTSRIPTFYRICFTIFDPLLAGFGVYANCFQPQTILSGFTPNPLLPPSPETTVLLHGMAGFFAMLAFLQVVLLRARPNDVPLWRYLQAGVLFQDFFMVGAFLIEMNELGRLDTSVWRANDWANIIIYPALIALRFAFVFGLGLSRDEQKGKVG